MMWYTTYQSDQNCVSWPRPGVQEVNAFDDFLQHAAGNDVLAEHLLELSLNSTGQDVLEEVPAEQILETRDWTVGRSLVIDTICYRQCLETLPKQVWGEALGRKDTVYRGAWMTKGKVQ